MARGTERLELARSAFPDIRIIELGEELRLPGCVQSWGRGWKRRDRRVAQQRRRAAAGLLLERLTRPFTDPQLGSTVPTLVQPGGLVIDCVGHACRSHPRRLSPTPRASGRPRRRIRTLSSQACVAAGGAYRRAGWEQVEGLDEGVRLLRRGHRSRATHGRRRLDDRRRPRRRGSPHPAPGDCWSAARLLAAVRGRVSRAATLLRR